MPCWIFALFSCIFLAADTQRFSVAEYPAEKMHVVKECNHHTVFFSGFEYVKIWKKGSWHFQNGRNKVFLAAVDKGFFDKIAPLKGVIMEDSECIGYITYPCNAITQKFIVQSIEDLKNKDAFEHHDSVVELFRTLKKEIIREQFCFFGDFMGSWNMGIKGNKCYFFDLDRIMTLDEYLEKWKNQPHLFFLHKKF